VGWQIDLFITDDTFVVSMPSLGSREEVGNKLVLGPDERALL
jgi:hypothetical protein